MKFQQKPTAVTLELIEVKIIFIEENVGSTIYGYPFFISFTLSNITY